MYHFRNDYSEGAHPRVLEALIRTNLESTAVMERTPTAPPLPPPYGPGSAAPAPQYTS